MERILEPEYMDTPEETEGYDAMDHRAANQSFVEDVLAARQDQRRFLDLGTGPGDIPILLAQTAADIEIVGVDAAATMLALAERKVAAANLADRIELRQADVKQLPMEDRSVDAVISNTILHHIPDPVLFLREAWRVCAPGGLLFIRDLYRPGSEAAARDLVETYAADGTETQRKLFFDSLHAALTLDEARAAVAEAGIDTTAGQVTMTSDRHYTIRFNRA